MQIAKVLGAVWATRKHHSLDGIKLCVIQPLDHHRKPRGSPLIAPDITNQVGRGETVFFVEGGDATRLMPGPRLPFDAAVVGIIDSLSTDKTNPTDALS
ncbi:MAG: EutN/CcmL family microcompartment protein [bacterium]